MVPLSTRWIHICDRAIPTVHIQIPRLHDCIDLRDICIRFQPQRVFPLVDLLRVIPVDHVGDVPVGVHLGETPNGGIIVPCAEIVGPGFVVPILPAVTEGIDVCAGRVSLVAERVVPPALICAILLLLYLKSCVFATKKRP